MTEMKKKVDESSAGQNQTFFKAVLTGYATV